VIRRAPLAAGLLAAAALGALGTRSPAHAQDPAAAAAVEVTVVGTAADLERVRSLVPRLPGGVRWTRVDRLQPADVLRAGGDRAAPAVRAWVDLTVAKRARLTFATRPGDRFLIRDLDLSGRFDEVDRAALTEVLESSVGALAGDDRAGLSRADAEEALAAEEPAAAAPAMIAPRREQTTLSWQDPIGYPRPSRRAIGIFYGGQVFGPDGALDHGFGVSLAYAAWRNYRAAHETGRGPVVFASAQYRFPAHEDTPRVGVALDTIAARAGVECGPLGWSRLRVRLAAGADFVHVAPESSDPAVMLASKHWTATLVATAALRINVVEWGHVHGSWWSLLLFADALPTAVHYDLAVDGATTTVFSPWRLRPGAALEAAFF